VTFEEALLDPRIPLRWLLWLSPDSGTTAYRFAEGAQTTGTTRWAGALRMDTPPSLDYDPFTGAVSVGNTQVTLLPQAQDVFAANPVYPKDLDAMANKDWPGWQAKLFLWAEGTAESEAKIRIDGRVRKPKINPDRSISMTVIDKSLLFDLKLPVAYFDERNPAYGNCDKDEKGLGFALLYGPLQDRCVRFNLNDSTPDYVNIAHGAMYAVDRIAAGDVEQTFTASQYTDPVHSIPCTVAEIATLGDGVVMAFGAGQKDDAAGSITGYPNSYIGHLIQQLHHAMLFPCGISATEVDGASVAALVAALGTFDGAIKVRCDETTTLGKVREEVGRVSRSFIGIERGKIVMRLLDFNAAPVLDLFDGGALREIKSIKWVDEEELATKILFKANYAWSGSDKKYDYRNVYEYSDANCAALRTMLGFDLPMFEFATKMLVSETACMNSSALIAALRTKYRRIIECVVNRTGHALKMCDVVHLSTPLGNSSLGGGWSALHAAVIGITPGTDTLTLKLLEC